MKGNRLSNILDPKRKMTNLEGLNGTHVRDIVKSRKGETGQGEGATSVAGQAHVNELEERLPSKVHDEQIDRILSKLSQMSTKEREVTLFLAALTLNQQ